MAQLPIPSYAMARRWKPLGFWSFILLLFFSFFEELIYYWRYRGGREEKLNILCALVWQDIKHSNFNDETGHWQWQTWLATSQFSSSNSSAELSVIVTRCQVPLSLAVGLQAPKEIITWNSPIWCGFCICWDKPIPKQIPSAFLLTVNISVKSSWVSQKAGNRENKFLLSVAETWSLLFKRTEKCSNLHCTSFFWGRPWKLLMSCALLRRNNASSPTNRKAENDPHLQCNAEDKAMNISSIQNCSLWIWSIMDPVLMFRKGLTNPKNNLRYVNIFKKSQVCIWGHMDHLKPVRS